MIKTREAGDSAHPTAVARSAGLFVLIDYFLGFRFAAPQALRCHPLRGFKNWLLQHLILWVIAAVIPYRNISTSESKLAELVLQRLSMHSQDLRSARYVAAGMFQTP